MAVEILIAVGLTLLFVVTIINYSSGEKGIRHEFESDCSIRETQFIRNMGHLLGPPVTAGNKVETLVNGDEIFPAMLEAIRGAGKTITFETFIYWSGDVAKEFARALVERAKSGVKVHVLLDWFGSKEMDLKLLRYMKKNGIDVQRYHEPRFAKLHSLNNRTHRKILVVDGKIGFTGGVGIADEWSGNAEDADHWRDNHYRIEGPVVADLQAAFMDNWLKTHASVLHGKDYFPELEERGSINAQMFKSSPQEGSQSARLMFLLAIASARHSIRLSSAYFVPDELTVKMLCNAARRKVKIEIIVPGKEIDTRVTRRASRARWGKLLRDNIIIYEYKDTMYHTKLMVVDDFFVSIGSANWDNRSFRLNDEANLNIFDTDFAHRQTELFEKDRSRAEKYTYGKWLNRPLWEKVTENLAKLFRWHL